MNLLVALLCCNTCGLLNHELINNSSPKVMIVGGGPAGIAAASRLLENGFTDITILEAENRIGGRVYSRKFGDYMVDMGGQWVHGEKGNVAFELAEPLGLLEKLTENYDVIVKFFGSNGHELPVKIERDLQILEKSIAENIPEDDEELSYGEYAESIYREYFNNHSSIQHLFKPILHAANLVTTIVNGATNSWYDISAKGFKDYADCDGDGVINWKNRTYSTILDILMKKYPNPEEELPVLENTYKNNKVTKINYNKDYDKVKISTANNEEYFADHVIFTPSLGVLKANYQRLFNPPLPENKVKAIKNIGFGHAAKIWLYFDDPWWVHEVNEYILTSIYWTDQDREEIENDPERNWMLGISGLMQVEHKPKLLCLWVSSERAVEMELIPEEILSKQIIDILHRFYGRVYHITEPTKIIRSSWNTNENFEGIYSYPAVSAQLADVSYLDLAEPIMRNDKPILQFAGEATSEHFATVHGAIESGWREADRLINLYTKANDLSKLLKRISQES